MANEDTKEILMKESTSKQGETRRTSSSEHSVSNPIEKAFDINHFELEREILADGFVYHTPKLPEGGKKIEAIPIAYILERLEYAKRRMRERILQLTTYHDSELRKPELDVHDKLIVDIRSKMETCFCSNPDIASTGQLEMLCSKLQEAIESYKTIQPESGARSRSALGLVEIIYKAEQEALKRIFEIKSGVGLHPIP